MSNVRKEIDFEMDMLLGNLNRMMITDNFEELNGMYEVACIRIVNIGRLLCSLRSENVSRLNLNKEN